MDRNADRAGDHRDRAILKSSSGFTSSTVVNWGGAGYVTVPGDYDGDGRIDPAVYNPATGDWLALTSSSSYTAAFHQNWGPATSRRREITTATARRIRRCTCPPPAARSC